MIVTGSTQHNRCWTARLTLLSADTIMLLSGVAKLAESFHLMSCLAIGLLVSCGVRC